VLLWAWGSPALSSRGGRPGAGGQTRAAPPAGIRAGQQGRAPAGSGARRPVEKTAPPAAQGKNLSDFDHVKKGLALVGEEELAQQAADPMFGIKADGLSEDVKRAMGKLNSADAAQARPLPAAARALPVVARQGGVASVHPLAVAGD